MPELVAPTLSLHAAWLEAHHEWGPGVHEDGFGLHSSDEVDSPAGFAAWVARLTAQADPAKPVAAGRVHCTYRWIVEDDRVQGAIALRHTLNDRLLQLGRIGEDDRAPRRGPRSRPGHRTRSHAAILDQHRPAERGWAGRPGCAVEAPSDRTFFMIAGRNGQLRVKSTRDHGLRPECLLPLSSFRYGALSTSAGSAALQTIAWSKLYAVGECRRLVTD